MGRGTWKPEFQGWDEDKVEMVDEEVTTHSNSRNEYGVAFQMTDTPYTGDGAIFWIDMHHIYFRFDWGHWYKVSTEDLENCAQICKRSSAKLLVCTATSLKHHSIRVYHIKSLPEELFGPQDGARPDACSNGPQREDRDGSAETPEGSDGGASFSLCVMNMGGSPITRYRGNAHRCDIYELNGHIVLAVFFNHPGDWLADEESFNNELPFWYGTTSISPSPFAVARAIRQQIEPVVPNGVRVQPIVVLNYNCEIINEYDYDDKWNEENIIFARDQRISGSEIGTIREALQHIKGTPHPELAELAHSIRKALEEPLPNGPKED